MDRHPHLIRAIETVLSMTKEKELKYFRIGVAKLLESHLNRGLEWFEDNNDLLSKLDQVVADFHEDDMAICQFAIDEWEDEDRAIGMRYIALCKRYKQLMPVERKQILKEEINKQEKKIKELTEKANSLGHAWLKKLSKHTYNPHIAKAITWLSNVTSEELIANYSRWDKETL
jgi:hypothetical protein